MKFDYNFGISFINSILKREMIGEYVVSPDIHKAKRRIPYVIMGILTFLPVCFLTYVGITNKLSVSAYMVIMAFIMVGLLIGSGLCFAYIHHNTPYNVYYRKLRDELSPTLASYNNSFHLILFLSLVGKGNEAIKVFTTDQDLLNLLGKADLANSLKVNIDIETDRKIEALIEADCHKVYDQYAKPVVTKTVSKILSSGNDYLMQLLPKDMRKDYVNKVNIAN